MTRLRFGDASCCRRLLSDLKTHWKLFLIILTPIVLCPLPIVIRTSPACCAYVVLIMIVYWLTEILPLAVTALIPLVFFPLFGIMTAGNVAMQYLKDTNWVFFGSLMMALAVEQSQLHHRVGLFTLTRIGSSPRRLMLGFMVSTCFLSMWMSNTASTAMMVPLVLAVIKGLMESQAENAKNLENGINNDAFDMETPNQISSTMESGNENTKSDQVIGKSDNQDFSSVADAVKSHASPKFQRTCKGLLLSICYSANIGGTGTMTGTGANLVLAGQLDRQSIYGTKDTGLSFATWMAFSLPQMIVILILAWIWLQIVFVGFQGCTQKQDAETLAIKAVLQRKYKELKPMSFAEITTTIMFGILILLWLLRKPGFIPGWGDYFPAGYVTDGTTAMIVGLLLFVVPREMPQFRLCSGTRKQIDPKPTRPLLMWSSMQKEFPWGIVILVGGGYAMAAGVQNSGLDAWISRALVQLDFIPTYAFVAIGVVMVTFITEFTSNAAIASIFVPIGASVAAQMHIHPLYIVLPVTIACSFAFMLPVASPPNAIVFSAGLLRVVDMAITGFVMNIICMAILLINVNTYGCWLFQFNTFPSWAMKENVTTTTPLNNQTHL